jgi:S1-C subfamily serine protease
VAVPRETTPSTAFLRSQVPRRHPSAAVLGEERMGAAVAVGAHQVLTAHYLVMGASRIQLAGADGRPRDVRRFRVDHETGLALLTLDGPPLRPARLRERDDVAPGEPIFLLTCTSKGERKGATGHVCMVGPFEAFWEYMLDRAIMTTAINPGLAGAPLFDSEGRLIGVVSLSLAAVGRYSLAIPIDLYRQRREILETEGPDRSRPARAWTGIYPQAYDGGVVLTGVVPGGPGDKAGLARGDLILSVDGQTVASLRELYATLWKRAPGESVSLQVLRDGAIRVVEVAAGDRDEFYK